MLPARAKRYLGTAAILSSIGWLVATLLLSLASSTPVNVFTLSALLGLLQFVGVGILLLGVAPLALSTFMSNTSSALDLINRAALMVALASIFMGVLFALATIYGNTSYTRHLLTCVVLFVGSAATLCTLRFFYTNRSGE